MKKILYAGDSLVGGAANYLMAIIKANKIVMTHVPPGVKLKKSILKTKFDGIILSDFAKNDLPSDSEKIILRQVSDGTGLMMIGGWGSFSGPFGGWKGSKIEGILPVSCLGRDDRMAFPGGAIMFRKKEHPMFGKVSFTVPPVICGMNKVRIKRSGKVILTARKIACTNGKLLLDFIELPLFVVDADPKNRIAALTTDLAPHWCGGLLDWGGRAVKLPVTPRIHVEVGKTYIIFVSSILKWLVGSN